jgi:PIN domain nuclease of toxin-antitoxin system
LGKLVFEGSATAAIEANGFLALPIAPEDAEAAGALDWAHGDPFDRMLIAQASRHGLTLVTADRLIREYGGIAQLWAG